MKVSVQNPSNSYSKYQDLGDLKKSQRHSPSPIQLQQQQPSKKSLDIVKLKKKQPEIQEHINWPFFRPDFLNDEKFWDQKNVKFPQKSNIIFQGVLLRIGRNKKNVKGYCYKLTQGGCLYYFRRDGDPVAKGSVQLSLVVSAHIEEQISKNGMILVIRIERLEGLSMTLFDVSNEMTLEFLDQIKNFCHVTGYEKLYQQMDILGKGSFATVFKIKSLKTGKYYAAKTYYRETFEISQHKEKFVTMIKNEIMALRKVSHPGIIKLYEIISEKDKFILVTELVNGGDLYSLIKITKRVNEKQAAILMQGVCDALGELHNNGFVHRDLKLENIMLESKNSLNIKLVDFGFAEPINENELVSKAGTPGYIPPEIFKLAPYTAKGDIFSVGIIFYSLITGTSAFKGKNYSQVLQENRKCDINFERSIWKEISPEFKSLLKKMVAARPQTRITCADVLQSDWLQEMLQNNQERAYEKINKVYYMYYIFFSFFLRTR